MELRAGDGRSKVGLIEPEAMSSTPAVQTLAHAHTQLGLHFVSPFSLSFQTAGVAAGAESSACARIPKCMMGREFVYSFFGESLASKAASGGS